MVNKDEKLQDKEYQALAARMKRGKKKRETHSPKAPRRPQKNQKVHRGPHRGNHRNHEGHQDHSNFRCFNCDKMGHIARNYPLQKEQFKKNRKKRHHANAIEEEDEPIRMPTREER